MFIASILHKLGDIVVLAYIDPEFHCFGPNNRTMGHSAAGENRKGVKIVMQPCFIIIYLIVGIKVALHI